MKCATEARSTFSVVSHSCSLKSLYTKPKILLSIARVELAYLDIGGAAPSWNDLRNVSGDCAREYSQFSGHFCQSARLGSDSMTEGANL